MTRRAVIVGSAGFVGSAIMSELATRGWDTVGITRSDVDLTSHGAVHRMKSVIRDGDTVVFAAADAPCKTLEQLESNVRMMRPLLDTSSERRLAKIVYVSSDAVYADSTGPLSETSLVGPASIHGAMHSLRETLIRIQDQPSLIIRPTLIFGAGDPHNGYGPNMFMRNALAGREIVIFGEGEERRDHIHISDVANYSAIAIEQAEGVVNLATGEVQTFKDLAEHALRITRSSAGIRSKHRIGPMPHGGHRAFDVTYLRRYIDARVPISAMEGMERDMSHYGN